MKRGDRVVASVFLIIAALFALSFAFKGRAGGTLTADITKDGETVRSVRLDKNAEPLKFAVGDTEHYNVIEVSNGAVSVTDSSCYGRDCVKTGAISRAGRSIICLPNRLSITIRGESGVDAAAY